MYVRGQGTTSRMWAASTYLRTQELSGHNTALVSKLNVAGLLIVHACVEM